MSNDVSKVYLFLAQQGDWQSVADTNGDGGITKSEFREFMENNFDWDGETTAEGKNDLINTFWKSIDTNTTGKISGTNLKNKNALDSGEIANMETRIEMYEILDDFISTNVKCPSVVSDSANWKTGRSIRNGLPPCRVRAGRWLCRKCGATRPRWRLRPARARRPARACPSPERAPARCRRSPKHRAR